MTHVFVAPHPDDVALSCGGLVANLRELGQNVTILTVYSGTGPLDDLSPYQREALGFGTKAIWPVTEAFNRANIPNDFPTDGGLAPWAADSDRLDATQTDADQAARRFWQRSSWYRRADIHNRAQAGQQLMDDQPNQGAILTEELIDAEDSGDIAAARRLEDERFSLFAEASIVHLDLPDAVYRGYEGDEELLGTPRDDDPAPIDVLRREIARLEPQKVYLPLGVGNHVDHQLVRDAGIALLGEGRRWVMPGPEYTGIVTFYEDFPYAWWSEFGRLEDLPAEALAGLPADVSLRPEFADIADTVERKIIGVTLYASQLDRLFGGRKPMAASVRAYGTKVAALGGISGYAERYWASTRI
ncbi:MAG TPA: PIG-L family deacetylase [Candidatus Saccharimonadales bacterium]|nr:PIG-L family deacetylase [Candidatus Saccharimonadales bacterium]